MILEGKTALITGGGSGLGLSAAKILGEKGVKVHICGRTKNTLQEAQKLISGGSFIHQCDISDFKQVEAMIGDIGNVDILINTAGLWLEGQVEHNTTEQIKRTIGTNLEGVINTSRALIPSMKKQGCGFIVNVSSTSGLKGRSNQSVYAATKAAVHGFTESLKVDLADTNIKVVGFYPGGMNTGLFASAGTPKQNQDWMDPKKVANIIIFALEQDDTMFIDHIVVNKRQTKTTN